MNELTLDTRRFTRILFALAFAIAVVGAVVNVLIYQVAASPDADIARVLARFDLGHEPSIPAWFSSILLLLDAAMLFLIGAAERRAGRPYAFHWLFLGAVFVLLSADEAALFHEMLDTALAGAIDSTGVTRGGFLLFPWVIAGLLFVATLGLFYGRFLLQLPRRFALLFIAAGALYVGGAVGMELMSSQAIDRFTMASLAHTATQTIEESMEMAGAILFFFALGEYWTHRHGRLSARIADATAPEVATLDRGWSGLNHGHIR